MTFKNYGYMAGTDPSLYNILVPKIQNHQKIKNHFQTVAFFRMTQINDISMIL